jgi:CRP-like cAMP-binding protein
MVGAQNFDKSPDEMNVFIFIIDCLVDTIFTIDIFISFRTAESNPQGKVVFEWSTVTRNYVTSWFVPDVLSVIPWYAFTLDGENGNWHLLRLCRLFRLSKLHHLSRIYRRWEPNIKIKYGVIRLWKFAIGISFVWHWITCGWFLVGKLSQTHGYPNWLDKEFLRVEDWSSDLEGIEPIKWGFSSQYIVSAYWAIMTLTTIGYGDVSPQNEVERLYCIFCMVTGALIFSYVVGTMCTLVQGLDQVNLKFQNQMDQLDTYLQIVQIPKDICQKIREFCIYKRDNELRKGEEQELLSYMSKSLQEEVVLHIYKEILEELPLFRGAPLKCLAAIALVFRSEVFGPNERIITQGELGDSLYILKKGSACVEVSTLVQTTIVKTLGEGRYFGENSLMYCVPRTATVRTISFCETVKLLKGDLDKILDLFPILQYRFRSAVIKKQWSDIMRNGKLSEALKVRAAEREQREKTVGPKSKTLSKKRSFHGRISNPKPSPESPRREIQLASPTTHNGTALRQLEGDYQNMRKSVTEVESKISSLESSVLSMHSMMERMDKNLNATSSLARSQI